MKEPELHNEEHSDKEREEYEALVALLQTVPPSSTPFDVPPEEVMEELSEVVKGERSDEQASEPAFEQSATIVAEGVQDNEADAIAETEIEPSIDTKTVEEHQDHEPESDVTEPEAKLPEIPLDELIDAVVDEPDAHKEEVVSGIDTDKDIPIEDEVQGEARESLVLEESEPKQLVVPEEEWKLQRAYYDPKEKNDFKFDPLKLYKGMFRRFLLINKHTIGLFTGGLLAFRKVLEPEQTRGMRFLGTRILAALVRPFVDKQIRELPFPTQLRKRLELLGPTYIKLGQVLALREDILPTSVTDELKNLLDRLPEVPFPIIRAIIERNLGRSLEECFSHINIKPIGSASIAQTHLATTLEGEKVVLKVVKPGIREAILTDIQLLKLLAKFLQWAIPQYQPKVLIDEFCAYTEKEVDLTNEADNAELFAANFDDMEGVAFPKIYRAFTARDVLCMEFFKGFKPGAPETYQMPVEDRLLLVEYGAEAIIRMLYKDGFFHADLHPGNLIILEGPKVGFIDLGMTGRFEDRTRRQMLYYFNALVSGDMDGAGKYLVAMARIGEEGDPNGFRRELADLSRKFYTHAKGGDFSLAQLIMQSVGIGGKYRVFFPVEMTLMVKALVTFEGVGMVLDPKLDVPRISQKYVTKIFKDQFSPQKLVRDFMRGTPELVDVLVNLPKFTSDGINFLDRVMNEKSPGNPLAGLRSGIIAGACIIGGVISLTVGGDIVTTSILFGLAVLLSLFGK